MTGILTESPGLHDKLTARQNLAYYGAPLRTARRDPAATPSTATSAWSALERRGRPSRRAASRKGMRQKVAIARALLHEPQVIYLDEPTSGLDPSAAKTVRDFVSTLRNAGRSIVICTHNLDEAERLCRPDRRHARRLPGGRHAGRPATRGPLGDRSASSSSVPRGPAVGSSTRWRGLPFVLGGARRGATACWSRCAIRAATTRSSLRPSSPRCARIVAVREEAATLEEV